MENADQIIHWTDQAITHWLASGIKLQTGASRDKIQDIEKTLRFHFPQDFVELYTKANGFEDFDWNEQMFSLWSLERIVKEYQEQADKNYIGFCDYLISSHHIGFLKNDTKVYKLHSSPELVTERFKDFILMLNRNDELLF